MNALDPRKTRRHSVRKALDAVQRWWSTPAMPFYPAVPGSVTDYPFRRPDRPRR